jgi:hypothetical protein
MARGDLPYVKISARMTRFLGTDVEEFLRRHRIDRIGGPK